MDKKPTVIEPWMMKIIDKAHEHAHRVIVEQMKINPDALEALYE